MDSSAVLALLKDEPGADVIEAWLPVCLISAVNYAESLSKAALLGFDADAVDQRLSESGMRVASVDISTARRVAALADLGRSNVSLADRFCLALALERNLPVVTGDRAWVHLGLPLEIILFR